MDGRKVEAITYTWCFACLYQTSMRRPRTSTAFNHHRSEYEYNLLSTPSSRCSSSRAIVECPRLSWPSCPAGRKDSRSGGGCAGSVVSECRLYVPIRTSQCRQASSSTKDIYAVAVAERMIQSVRHINLESEPRPEKIEATGPPVEALCTINGPLRGKMAPKLSLRQSHEDAE